MECSGERRTAISCQVPRPRRGVCRMPRGSKTGKGKDRNEIPIRSCGERPGSAPGKRRRRIGRLESGRWRVGRHRIERRIRYCVLCRERCGVGCCALRSGLRRRRAPSDREVKEWHWREDFGCKFMVGEFIVDKGMRVAVEECKAVE